MRVYRKSAWLGAAAFGVAVIAGLGTAVAGYTTGTTYKKASPGYQVGYATGAIDMIAALQGAKFLKPGPMNDDVARIAKCLTAKKIKQSQIRGAYLSYLKASPKSTGENAAIDVFNAVKIACQNAK